jgi:hypothetical protein
VGWPLERNVGQHRVRMLGHPVASFQEGFDREILEVVAAALDILLQSRSIAAVVVAVVVVAAVAAVVVAAVVVVVAVVVVAEQRQQRPFQDDIHS